MTAIKGARGYGESGRPRVRRGTARLPREMTPAERAARAARRDEATRREERRIRAEREVDEVTSQIRAATAELRRARTPAERAALEQVIVPLVHRRLRLLAALPRTSVYDLLAAS